MKYLVISDIHGDLHGAGIMKEAFTYHKCDYILCLGDILYHGPRNDLPDTYAPKKVIPLMNSFRDRIIAIRGNCEAEVDQMVLEFPCMADYSELFLKQRKLFMSHGHIYSPDHLPVLRKGDIFLSGHTHIPTAYKKNGIFLLNPGSPSLPKGGHPKTYGILEDDAFAVFTEDHKQYMHISFDNLKGEADD